MNGNEELTMAIELQRQFPKYLRIEWKSAIVDTLADGEWRTINQIMRILKLDSKQTKSMRICMRRLCFIGLVKKFGIEYKRSDKLIIDYRQRRVTDYPISEAAP